LSGGTLRDSIRMGNMDFVHLVKPRICSFAERGGATSTDGIRACLSPEQGGGK
jgi:hypothetical protein